MNPRFGDAPLSPAPALAAFLSGILTGVLPMKVRDVRPLPQHLALTGVLALSLFLLALLGAASPAQALVEGEDFVPGQVVVKLNPTIGATIEKINADYGLTTLDDTLDADGNGLKDEMVGHGTHVAGIVGLVAPAAKIMPIRVLDSEGYGDVFTIAKAISYAKSNGADVINLSLGSSSHSKLLQDVIKDAIKNGVVVAAAAGNSNSSLPH